MYANFATFKVADAGMKGLNLRLTGLLLNEE